MPRAWQRVGSSRHGQRIGLMSANLSFETSGGGEGWRSLPGILLWCPAGKGRSMKSTPLDYLSRNTPRTRRRWPWRAIGVGVAVLLVAVAALLVTIRQDESQMDAVTGSMTSKTIWLFGITTGPHMEVSPLEMRLKASGIAWTPSWQLLNNMHLNIFGGATIRECASAPAIYHLRPGLKEFAAGSTDAELREFVRIMQTGTDDERKAAVEAAAEKALRAISSPTTEPL